MAISDLLLSSSTSQIFRHRPAVITPRNHQPSFSLIRRPALALAPPQCKGSSTADGPDRLISAITYFYPFFDGVQYGRFAVAQFPPLQTLIQPLVPAIRVFRSTPINGILVFFTLYFFVVRNRNFSKYVRFNTMQAIVLDVLLIIPDLLDRSFDPGEGIGSGLMMSFDSTVFLFLLVCLIYGSSSCFIGKVPRLPLVAEAADRQVL